MERMAITFSFIPPPFLLLASPASRFLSLISSFFYVRLSGIKIKKASQLLDWVMTVADPDTFIY